MHEKYLAESKAYSEHAMTSSSLSLQNSTSLLDFLSRLCTLHYLVCSATQSCLTLCNPMNCNLPGSSVHGIFQARILEWVAISFSRGSSWPRDQTHISWVSCTGRWVPHHCSACIISPYHDSLPPLAGWLAIPQKPFLIPIQCQVAPTQPLHSTTSHHSSITIQLTVYITNMCL